MPLEKCHHCNERVNPRLMKLHLKSCPGYRRKIKNGFIKIEKPEDLEPLNEELKQTEGSESTAEETTGSIETENIQEDLAEEQTESESVEETEKPEEKAIDEPKKKKKK